MQSGSCFFGRGVGFGLSGTTTRGTPLSAGVGLFLGGTSGVGNSVGTALGSGFGVAIVVGVEDGLTGTVTINVGFGVSASGFATVAVGVGATFTVASPIWRMAAQINGNSNTIPLAPNQTRRECFGLSETTGEGGTEGCNADNISVAV